MNLPFPFVIKSTIEFDTWFTSLTKSLSLCRLFETHSRKLDFLVSWNSNTKWYIIWCMLTFTFINLQFTISQNLTFYTFLAYHNISLTHLFGYEFIDQTVNKFGWSSFFFSVFFTFVSFGRQYLWEISMNNREIDGTSQISSGGLKTYNKVLFILRVCILRTFPLEINWDWIRK